MTAWDRLCIVADLARALAAAIWHDTRFPTPVPENPRFMTARQAAALIEDGDVVAVSGLGGNQRASILFWAIREMFDEIGRPAGLTLVNLGGHGGRGLAPGTMEELGVDGLCHRLVTGHFDTFRAMLALAHAGRCELQCIPQGTLALLIDALGRGADSLVSTTGVGTFIDPRVGTGSPVAGTGEQLVSVEGERLRYRMPPIDVAIFNAPAADRHGNVYVRRCAMIGETAEIARAAKRNHGRVIANVGLVVPEGWDRVYLPADRIDAVVYHPDTEQAAAIPHRRHWAALTTESDVPVGAALERARFVNRLAGLTERRGAADGVTARLAAWALAAEIRRGAQVNVGTGLPELVCQELFAAGLHEALTLLVESGPVGGVPAPGVYFGASFSPREIVSSAEMFARCRRRLDATCLGLLEGDGAGNVNVSRRSESIGDYVGPGGFIDLSTAARVVVFVSGWMVGGEIAVEGARVRVVRRGRPKFVARVREITFNGPRALAAGKRVLYATPVGLFRLEAEGMTLVARMPGIDVGRDVLAATPMRVVLPPGGPALVPRAVVTGEGFAPRLGQRSRRTRS